MEVPMEITFRDVEKTPELEEYIRQRVDQLEKINSSLISCRLAVEKPNKHQESGNPYRVRIDARVPPGHELVVESKPREHPMHESLHAVITDTFDAVERRLRKLRDQMQGKVKDHPHQEGNAFVARIFKEQGYGFIRDYEGTEYYFHRNSVLDEGFELLEPGATVRFAAEQGEKGPQASTVELVGKPAGGIGG